MRARASQEFIDAVKREINAAYDDVVRMFPANFDPRSRPVLKHVEMIENARPAPAEGSWRDRPPLL